VRDLRKKISQIIKTFPKDEKYILASQALRLSRPAASNIAEGFGRFHYQDNEQFYCVASGSLFEILDHLSCADDEQYINDDGYNEMRVMIFKCIKILNGYIGYLNKAARSAKATQIQNNPITQE
jgi:four helix bundle protein